MKKFGRKLCAILCAAMLAGVLVPTASAATFTDVTDHWAASYIETCAGLGIVDGVGGGKFEPKGKVTNAQFVKMLCAAFYSAEEQTFENENRAVIDTYFGGSIQWYSYQSYYFQALGLLNSVDYNIQSAVSANQPMNRNNMAQITAKVNNPCNVVNLSDVRPGDVIYQIDSGNTGNDQKHAMVVIDTIKENGKVTRVFVTEGNYQNAIHWDENNGNSWDIWNAWAIEDLGACVAYTRYPN